MKQLNASFFWKLVLALAVYGAATLFVVHYVGEEIPAYSWDWGKYYGFYQQIGAYSKIDLMGTLIGISDSIRVADYNASSIFFLIPSYHILGRGREAYILGLVFCFLIPAIWVATRLASTAVQQAIQHPLKPPHAALIALMALLFPPFWQATLRGMPDVVGLIPLGGATLLLLRTQFLTRQGIESAAVLGVLVWLAFMFRRWYAFSSLALLIMGFVAASTLTMRQRAWPTVFKQYAIAGGTCVGLLAMFQSDLAWRILTTSYADIYQAYQAPLSEHFVRLYEHAGPVFATLVVLGNFLALRPTTEQAGPRIARPVVFASGTAVLIILLFSRTQAPGVQHGLPIQLLLLPSAALALVWLSERFSQAGRVARYLGASTAITIMLLAFGISFVPQIANHLPQVLRHALGPAQTYHPLYLENYSEYQRLLRDLQQRLTRENQLAVFASSELLSDSLLNELDRPIGPMIVQASQVDERDGLKIEPLAVRYALIATPTPLHLPESSQRVISVPADMIRRQTGLGADYRPIAGPYQLAGGHVATLYERTTPLTDQAVQQVEAALQQYHPHWVWQGRDRIAPP